MAAWGTEEENLTGEIARVACSSKCGGWQGLIAATEYDLLSFGDGKNQCAKQMQKLIIQEIEAQVQDPVYSGGTVGGGAGAARGNNNVYVGQNKIENFKDIIDIALDKDCNPVVLLRNSVIRCVVDDNTSKAAVDGGTAGGAGGTVFVEDEEGEIVTGGTGGGPGATATGRGGRRTAPPQARALRQATRQHQSKQGAAGLPPAAVKTSLDKLLGSVGVSARRSSLFIPLFHFQRTVS